MQTVLGPHGAHGRPSVLAACNTCSFSSSASSWLSSRNSWRNIERFGNGLMPSSFLFACEPGPSLARTSRVGAGAWPTL